jgi:hypothetical protein
LDRIAHVVGFEARPPFDSVKKLFRCLNPQAGLFGIVRDYIEYFAHLFRMARSPRGAVLALYREIPTARAGLRELTALTTATRAFARATPS